MTSVDNPHRPGGVLVGIDGSSGSRQALDWVLAKGDHFGPVTAMLSYQAEPLGDGMGAPTLSANVGRILEEEAGNLLREVLAGRPDLLEQARVVSGRPGPNLIEASADFDLVVVGSRGRSTIAETLLGSIGSYCVKRARVPVAVVTPGTEARPTIDDVVVGLDGSDNSLAALRWAVDHVTPGGRIRAVSCGPSPTDVLAPSESETTTEVHLFDAIDEVVEAERVGAEAVVEGSTIIEPCVEQGDARQVLRRMADGADALVIGARGRQGLGYLVLGSVSTALLHHPTVTTVVVPSPTPVDED